jgi:hypothetical protein
MDLIVKDFGLLLYCKLYIIPDTEIYVEFVV